MFATMQCTNGKLPLSVSREAIKIGPVSLTPIEAYRLFNRIADMAKAVTGGVPPAPKGWTHVEACPTLNEYCCPGCSHYWNMETIGTLDLDCENCGICEVSPFRVSAIR